MKHWVVLLGVLLLGTSAGLAERVRLPVALRGTVQTEQGRSTITDQTLVSAPGNRLVLMIDVDLGIVAIEEWDPSLTAQIDRDPVLSGVQPLMENFRMAILNGRGAQFMANLEMVDMDWDHDGVEDTDGNMQIIARLTTDRSTGSIKRVSAQLVGVLNDPVNGAGGGVAKVFKGTVRSTGNPF